MLFKFRVIAYTCNVSNENLSLSALYFLYLTVTVSALSSLSTYQLATCTQEASLFRVAHEDSVPCTPELTRDTRIKDNKLQQRQGQGYCKELIYTLVGGIGG